MLKNSSLPRFKTVLTLGCIVLFCTFYWDFIVLRRLYSQRHPSHDNPARDSSRKFGWSWECVDVEKTKMCQRVLATSASRSSMSFVTCTMTCSPGRNLWPLPTGVVRINDTTASFHPRQLKVDFSPVDSVDVSILLKKTTKLYQERISKRAGTSLAQPNISGLIVMINLPKNLRDYKYRVDIDESYKIIVVQTGTTVQALVKASTFLGAHHGLETLMQLIWWDERDQLLKILSSVIVTDSPIFTYRGLLLDTARHFIPVPSIMRTLDAMSMNKMNVFHWHLADSKSFPFASVKFPKFKDYGPYSSDEIYSYDDIKQVVEYAEVRGVTVMVEVDATAHAGQGWDWGEAGGKGNLSLCWNSQPFSEFCSEPPCGQLNPANNNSYLVLAELIKELSRLTKSDVVHIGGDDVDFRCWESFGEVTDMEVYMNNGLLGVWEMFYSTLLSALAKDKVIPRDLIVWSNGLLDGSNFWQNLKNSSPIFQSRGSSSSGELERITKKKFHVIVSASDVWYLSEPKEWRSVYYHRPWVELSLLEQKLVIGGEACVWSGQLDHLSLEPRLWPVTAALAERLWTDPTAGTSPLDRLAWFREMMVQEGVTCSPVGPKWCLQNPYQCL